MIIVWRICADCGRRFSFWRKPGDGTVMHEACSTCDPEGHGLVDPMGKYLPSATLE